MKFEILRLDVWGNERDGYEVNNIFRTGLFIDVKDPNSVREIVTALKKEYLSYGIHASTFTIDGDADYTLYVSRTLVGKRTEYPICHLERVSDEVEVVL